ncbi:3-octaprenyl-4-hydroxybenzoate carboxy-lyase [Abeliophyllum distichum]|uniref:3-octaprenyl-4-hydroxybenzoate carboxy-lyase n=1 Tax=Abeliophyllum distichum TaxID=126358 RepID=A0ABD1QYD0_9LAMI
MRKTFYHNFYPNKAEEETFNVRSILMHSTTKNKILVEIRDVFPPPIIDPRDPWQMKKSIRYYEILEGELVVTFKDAFEHILRYWTLNMANLIVVGKDVGVIIWDVTEEYNPKKYQSPEIYFKMIPSGDFVLTCAGLIRDRNLNAYDKIGLYWDAKASHFMFKLLWSNPL